MKTAISIPDKIFKEVDSFAKEQNCSRSEVFVTAIKEFLEKLKAKKLLEEINEAYSDGELPDETTLRSKSKKYYAKSILKEQY